MTAYFRCICRSSEKLLAKRLQSEGYEIRDIRQNFEWRKEARQYDAKLPFTVVDGRVTEL